MAYICFIPFSSKFQQEFLDSCNQWASEGVNLKNPKNFITVSYTGQPQQTLLGLDGNSTIYIRGHGGIGGTTLSTNVTNAKGEKVRGETVSIDDVCQRLMDSGLHKSFSGKIKFSNCNSGVADPSKADRKVASAMQGAKYFRKKGYKSCRFFGYMGVLSNELQSENELENPETKVIHADLKDGFAHKNVNLPLAQRVGDRYQTVVRASQARQEFRPRTRLERALEFFGRSQ